MEKEENENTGLLKETKDGIIKTIELEENIENDKLNKKKKSIGKILRYFFGIIFILAGIGRIGVHNAFAIIMILFGISLCPIVYQNTFLKRYKEIQIIIPIILFVFCMIALPGSNKTVPAVNQEIPKAEITELKIEAEEITLDVLEKQTIQIKYKPEENVNLEHIVFESENREIAIFEKDNEEKGDKILYGLIRPISEGETFVYVSNQNTISNKIHIKIVDQARIEREKKEAEEAAIKKAAEEEKAKKEAEEQAQAQKQIEENKKKQSTTSQKTTKEKSSGTTQNNSKTVYRTPKGKRYHYISTCGGKNSYAITLDSAISSGLTPCQKCAQ